MKNIYVNLKRFDVPKTLGGVNGIADIQDWGSYILKNIKGGIKKYEGKAEFTFFMPEMHLLGALKELAGEKQPEIGCQGVCRTDVKKDGNFGALTTSLPAAAAKTAGCTQVLIGHCEERMQLAQVLAEAGVTDSTAVNRLLNKEVQAAIGQGMKVLYCIGEKENELENWQEVLGEQINIGLCDVDTSQVVIAYEPIWSIGPGKTPAGKEYIEKIAGFVKEKVSGIQVVYGGGLKKENAEMLASVSSIDGGLIALTRFQGEIGFYPEEYLEIVDLYLGGEGKS
ncbi:MAG: triose-phosphate isomerase [Lacrimispora sp.]|uniref:triose-phosphate isomerase n=1 Tax=Lacrimispora sp. TaxID=2719234 RepID=UPI0039E6E07A